MVRKSSTHFRAEFLRELCAKQVFPARNIPLQARQVAEVLDQNSRLGRNRLQTLKILTPLRRQLFRLVPREKLQKTLQSDSLVGKIVAANLVHGRQQPLGAYRAQRRNGRIQ